MPHHEISIDAARLIEQLLGHDVSLDGTNTFEYELGARPLYRQHGIGYLFSGFGGPAAND